jgi:chorismate mutase
MSSPSEWTDLPPGLPEARDEIDRIDAEIIRLISVRQSVVLRTYQIMRAVGMKLGDEERDEQTLDNAVDRATELDLPRKQVRKIFRQILRISEKSK